MVLILKIHNLNGSLSRIEGEQYSIMEKALYQNPRPSRGTATATDIESLMP